MKGKVIILEAKMECCVSNYTKTLQILWGGPFMLPLQDPYFDSAEAYSVTL